MADLTLNISAPGGLWMIIINWINSGVLNFAWTIILFTLLIKVVLSPFDFLIKYSTKKTTLIQQKCAPQIAKLQKKYGNNQQQFSVMQQNIYKKEGLNMMSSCLIMLVNLVVTILIFFSIYTTLREASAYYAIKQYQELNTAYTN
ncbi:MAG: YidC/Oxa1 family membrane protein insertase, partial [Clostridia bacterium]|nr:YidC/Oxa1 family membrane protein insertase [Clostridia bacterium]